MSSLYMIDQSILDCIDAETGEILDFDRLNALEMERQEKIESVALWIKNLKADAAAYKAEKDAFAEREKQAKGKVEKLSQWITDALQGQKMETAKVAVSFRKSSSVKVVDIDRIPDEYIVETITESPDKTLIKKALSGGNDVPGCELEVKYNAQIK